MSRLYLLFVPLFLFAAPFNGWTVWSYQDAAKDFDTCVSEYKELVDFARKEHLAKVVYYIKYHTAPLFFDPYSHHNEALVRLLSSYPLPTTCQLEVLFDCSPLDYKMSGRWKRPDYALMRSHYFADLHTKLCYALELKEASGGRISGITFDPEDTCTGSRRSTPNEIQKLINYVDAFYHVNTLENTFSKNITLGLDQVLLTYANRSPLPLAKNTPLGRAIEERGYTAFPLNTRPLWRKYDPRPLIDTVYVQAYQTDIPYLFDNLMDKPKEAALSFLSLLTLTPYRPGKGMVQINQGGRELRGQGTEFHKELMQYTPLSLLLDGQKVCICNDTEKPLPPRLYMACSSRVGERPQEPTLARLQGPACISSNGYVPYFFVEALINYRMVPVTYEMVDGITWMFSAEPLYFGQWTRRAFSHFVEQLIEEGQSFGVYKGQSQAYEPFSPHFAIYSFEVMRGKTFPPPRHAWLD